MHEMEAVVEMLKDKDLEPIMSEATKQNLEKLMYAQTYKDSKSL